MKKGILIVVAIILMILAVFPVVDYFFTKNLVYGKGELTNLEDYQAIQEYQSRQLNFYGATGEDFFGYFTSAYRPNSQASLSFNAIFRLMNIEEENGLTIFEPDSTTMIDYICYVIDLFLIWFVLFAILQVPIFTMRLMGLKEDKGGKRL